jgi:AcrR family transcriptional regulator
MRTMPTRKYNLETRRQKQAALKARIAAATADLHASKGAAATSYADIARQAGVSLPTVHSHFPTEAALFTSCTSHVAEHAPAIPVDKILQATTLGVALKRLITAMEAQHRYYEPWSARRMESYVSFLADLAEDIRKNRACLVAQILNHFLEHAVGRKVIAGCETLLSFDTWHRLVRGHGLTQAEARQILLQGLLSIIGPGATGDISSNDISSNPRRKSQ